MILRPSFRSRAFREGRARTVIAALVGGIVVALALLAPQFADAHSGQAAAPLLAQR
jgi:hypothetical protein